MCDDMLLAHCLPIEEEQYDGFTAHVFLAVVIVFCLFLVTRGQEVITNHAKLVPSDICRGKVQMDA